VKTKRYKSPEAASAVFWGISEEELMEGNITNFDEDGELSEFPAEQVMEGIRKVGVWGFVDPECCIHFWCTDDIDMKDLIGFFAHEIGHRTGRPIYDPKDSLVKPDDVTEEMLKDLKEEDMVDEETILEEELRAEDFRHVAEKAYLMALEVKEKPND